MNIPSDIILYIQTALNDELKTIEGSIELFKSGSDKYSETSSPSYELRQSEHSFALVLQEYTAELESIVFWIKKLNDSLEK